MKYVFLSFLMLCISSVNASITVGKSGLLQSELNGKNCRAYGVNYFDVFHRLLQDGKHQGYKIGFSELYSFGVPFVRFSAMNYWPKDFSLYFSDKEEYFRRLDLVFMEAEKNRIGLIPSLFFNKAMVPDLVGEPIESWSDPDSKTIQFMRQYVKEFFTRYSKSKALWAIEFSNEVNLYTDLPNAKKFRPAVDVAKGTAVSRTEEDDLALIDLQVALELFVKEVRTYDKNIPISSGNGHPRRYAYHNMKYKSWTLDSGFQTEYMLKASNPNGINLVSVHIYPHHRVKLGHLSDSGTLSYEKILNRVQKVAVEEGKVAFVGEFGVRAGEGRNGDEVEEFQLLMNAIYNSGVGLAALWVYRFDFQTNSFDVRQGSAREYQLRELLRFNNKLKDSGELCEF